MNLKETQKLMMSKDYKERFKAEYWQLKNRKEKLERLISDYWNGDLKFNLSCDIRIHEEQLKYMRRYFNILVYRAKIEEIDLGE